MLWPFELAEVDYLSTTGAVTALGLTDVGKAKGAIRLRFKATAGLTFDKIALDRLPVFLNGPGALPRQIYEEIFAQGLGLALRGKGGTWQKLGGPDCLRPMGFEDNEALLPPTAETFQGYRLLTEYFAFPERFLFVELSGFRQATRALEQDEIEVLILLGRSRSGLESTLDKSFFRLFCAPAINLFQKRLDRIHLSDRTNEYHVVPDRSRPMDFEVYQLQGLTGIGSAEEGEQVFRPFYAISDQGESGPREAFYMVRRQPRVVSSKQQRKGPRSSYAGGEIFVSLVDGSQAPFSSGLKQLAPEALCTNRDLPLTMPVGKGDTDFTLPSGGPVKSLRCVAGPTKPMPSFAEGESAWRLIDHLSLNYLSLSDSDTGQGAAALRELLSLYALRGNLKESQLVAGKEIEALQSVRAKRVVRRLPDGGPAAVARGLEITVALEEGAYEHNGLFLLGALLEHFFTRYVSINSFTETAIVAGDRGEVMRWPTRFGCRPTI
jgi:type VI secretion system protein ImpG